MLRLNDEEILTLDKHEEPAYYRGAEEGAKAQLKKVVRTPEWRKNLSALAYLELTSSPFWQSLLEEVKE